jgi:AraC-like DNA-binding protein
MSEQDVTMALQAAVRAERYRLWRARVRRARALNADLTIKDLARRFNVAPGTISKALK